MYEPKVQSARQMRNIHDIALDEVEELDAIDRNARKMLEIPVEPAMHCVQQVRIPTAKAPTQNVAVSKEGVRRPLALNEGRLSI